MSSFKPFIAPEESVRELSFKSLFIGILFSLIFAIANTYLGLKIGQTVSASIPAAVLSLGLSRVFFRNKTTVLEHNIIQTIATMGEGMAGGIVFALPALLLLGDTPSLPKIFLLSLLGGLLGIVFMIPVRRFLIVEEHKKLPYPEGTACAEILMASTQASANAIHAVFGFLISGFYKVLMNGLFLWNEICAFAIPFVPKTQISIDATPALLGLGYLIGFRIAAIMLCGGLLAWFILIPLIALFGEGTTIVYPATIAVSKMDPNQIWDHYIRYIGAGAVGVGGIVHLFKVIPLLFRAFKDGFKELLKTHHSEHKKERTDEDISLKWLILITIAVALTLIFIPYFSFDIISVLLLLSLALVFVTVASIACGVVGSSSSPVSGMLITVLLITCGVFLLLGRTEKIYLFSAITLSVVACVAIGLATNTSQDLKTGFLLGSTPWKQQVSQILGIITPSIIIGFTVYTLNSTYKIGSELMPAPQANLLAMIAEGVIEKTLPTGLVSIGIFLGILLVILEVPVIAFAIGLYLPLFLSSGIFVGGFVRYLQDRKETETSKGTLFASGLIGGDALFGVILAILTVVNFIPLSKPTFLPDSYSVLFYFILALITYAIATHKSKKTPIT